MYRALFGLINMRRCGRRGDGGCFQRHHGFTDYSLHSAGSGGAQYLCPPVSAKDRQRFLQEELQKRRERGKFIEW